MKRRELPVLAVVVALAVAALVGSTVAVARRLGDPKPVDRSGVGPEGSIAVTAVARDGNVGVGSEVGDDDQLLPGVLHATDHGWQRTSIPDASQVNDIAAAEGSYVVAGSSRRGPTAWVSADGINWTPAFTADSTGWGEFAAVAPTTHGFVAVGTSGTDSSTGAIVALRDGAAWRSIDLPVPDGYSAAQATDVVGSANLGRSSTPLVWAFDGVTWRVQPISTPVPGPVTHAYAQAVAATDDGLVVVGHAHARPAVWISADAVTWRPAQLPVLPPGTRLLDVAHTGGASFNAVGRIVSIGDHVSGIVLRSDDLGATWAQDNKPKRDNNGRGFTRVIPTDTGLRLFPDG